MSGSAPVRFPFREGRSTVYGRVYRPVARVLIRSARGSWLPHPMYVDTGADMSLVPRSVGELLGFRKQATDAIRSVGGLGGWIWVVMQRVSIRMGTHEFEADVGWAQTDEAPLVLGRADVFDRFDALVRQRDRVIEFHWRG